MTPQGTLGTFQGTKMCDVDDKILPFINFFKKFPLSNSIFPIMEVKSVASLD